MKRIALIATMITAIAAAVSAGLSWKSVQETQKAFQADLLERLEARWNSSRMITVRKSIATESQAKGPSVTGKLLLKQTIDYLDLIGKYAQKGIIQTEDVDYVLGYWIWGYYQVWQDRIAQIEKEEDLEWEGFKYIIDWMKAHKTQVDWTTEERGKFIKEEKTLTG